MKRAGLTLSLLLAGAAAALAQMPGGGGWGRGRPMGGPGGPGPGGPGEMFGLMAAGPMSRTPVTGAPYSGTQTSQMLEKLADGNVITRNNQSKVYRDKDGRMRIEHTFTPPPESGQTAQTRIAIIDPVAGVSYVLDPATNTAVKRTLPAPGTNPQPPPNRGANSANPPVKTDLGTQTFGTLQATGTQTVRTIPAGAIGNAQPIVITHQVWISTALQVPVHIVTTDPRFGNTTMDLTNVTLGDPDPTLFQVPSNYTISTAQGRGNGMMRGMGRGAPR